MVIKSKSEFDFKDQLKKGDAGEVLFKEFYHGGELEIIKENYADFKTSKGKILELKTDYYSMDASPNFFVERYSDFAKKSPGSFWQSQEKGVDLFVYMYIKNKTYFEFKDLDKTIVRLNELISQLKYVSIRNKGWTATGYKVPREALKDFYEEYKF